jgi:hypothetical protein
MRFTRLVSIWSRQMLGEPAIYSLDLELAYREQLPAADAHSSTMAKAKGSRKSNKPCGTAESSLCELGCLNSGYTHECQAKRAHAASPIPWDAGRQFDEIDGPAL